MKVKRSVRYLALLLALCILAGMTGCSKESTTYEEAFVPEEDSQYYYSVSNIPQTVAQTPKGYYFFAGNYLFFADSKEMDPIPVCGKPNCLHHKETDPTKTYKCNAYFSSNTEYPMLSYYKNHLYILSDKISESGSYLYRLDTDGTNLKELHHFEHKVYWFVIHRGYAYFTNSLKDAEGKSHYGLSRLPIKSLSQEPETVYMGSLKGGAIQQIQPYHNGIYFEEFAHQNPEMKEQIMRYDIKTKQTSCVIESTVDENEIFYQPTLEGFQDDRMIMSSLGISLLNGELVSSELYSCSLDGQDKQSVDKAQQELDQKNIQNQSRRDQKYIYYIHNDEDAYIDMYDASGKQLAQIPMDSYEFEVLPGDENYLFVLAQRGESIYRFAYDKEKLAQGVVEPITLLSEPFKNLYPAVQYTEE